MYIVIVNGKKVFYTPNLNLANAVNKVKHNGKGTVKKDN